MIHILYTLGYTGLKPEQLSKATEDLGAVVVDTRYSPGSMVPHWSRKQLAERLGNRYQHQRSLGNINYKNGGPIQIHEPQIGVPLVADLLERQPVILLCVCKSHEGCHRAVVAELVRAYCGCEITHLSALDAMAPPSQPDELFPETDFSAAPLPQPADQGGTLTLNSKPLPLHQLKMF